MFIAAIALSAIGFILLVVTINSNSQIWTGLLLLAVTVGIICFVIDEWRTRRRHRADRHRLLTPPHRQDPRCRPPGDPR